MRPDGDRTSTVHGSAGTTAGVNRWVRSTGRIVGDADPVYDQGYGQRGAVRHRQAWLRGCRGRAASGEHDHQDDSDEAEHPRHHHANNRERNAGEGIPGCLASVLVQDNMIGKIHFTLQAGGYTYGSIRAENWRAWNFRIEDHTGTEVARITKTFEGIAKTLFTTADNYVVQLHAQLPQPLLSLVVASALSVDTALKQDSRGLG